MNTRALDTGNSVEKEPQLSVVLGTHSREVKTALFHSLNAMPSITIVATGTSTAELVSYCHAFRPDVAIVECGLPGRSLGDVLSELEATNPNSRILLIGDDGELQKRFHLHNVEIFTDLGILIGTIPEQGADVQ